MTVQFVLSLNSYRKKGLFGGSQGKENQIHTHSFIPFKYRDFQWNVEIANPVIKLKFGILIFSTSDKSDKLIIYILILFLNNNGLS